MPSINLEQPELARMYQSKQRPLCPCRTPGIEMYIAKVGESYIVKRMPDTGPLHATDCEAYEPPPELSGLGDVLGSAIKENTESGMVELRFDFSMTKMAGRKPVMNAASEEDSVKADGSKLTLRSTLHYLWEESGFHKWSPGMRGKRSWFVLRKHLLQAAGDKLAKNRSLADQIFIPETFSADKKEAIKQHWLALVSRLNGNAGGPRQLMILIGEVKGFAPSRYGQRMIVKHAPDTIFNVSDELYKRVAKRFDNEITMSELDDVHLVTISTFSVNVAGIANIEEIALMTVTENWIPFETIHDKALIDKMTAENRRFTKGMRYNLPQAKPLACAVLSDTSPLPTALYILPSEPEEGYIATLDQLRADSALGSWVWNSSEFEPPVLPATNKPAPEKEKDHESNAEQNKPADD